MKQHPSKVRLWERLFGRSSDGKRYDEASHWGVPFEERHFWPPFYGAFGKDGHNFHLPSGIRPIVRDRQIIPDLYRADIGDTVPVFGAPGAVTLFYRVKGFNEAGGDDHIVSPRQFWIEFDRSETVGQTLSRVGRD